MEIQEIMSQPVYAVKATATVQFAAEMMATHNVGALPVTEDGHLVGIVTDRDIVLRVMAAGLSPTTTEVAKIMTLDPAALPPRADVEDAARFFMDTRVRRLPIVENGHPVGMVTADDVARMWGDDAGTLLMVRRVAPVRRRAAA